MKQDGPVESYNGDAWCSPLWLVDLAREALRGIDLDVASDERANQVVGAHRFITREENALSPETPWGATGGAPVGIFCNPPFSKVGGVSQVSFFLDRVRHEYDAGRVRACIMVTNVSTSAAWFVPMWGQTLCFLRRRVRFWHPDIGSTAPRASARFARRCIA